MEMYLRYLFRLKAEVFNRMHGLCFLIVLSFLFVSFRGSAQVVLSLDHQVKAGMPASTLSGVFWTMQLNYSVSSTTGSASGVKITIDLPDYIYTAEGMVGTIHAPVGNFVYSGTTGAKKLTITFIDPVPSGSTGVLEYRLRTLNGYTPDGTIIRPCAEMTDGSGVTSGIKCDEMPITASNKLCGFKTLKVNGAIGHPVTYRIYLGVNSGNPSNASNGSLNASDVTITDYYPAGATLVSVKAFNRNDVELTVPITYGTNYVTAQMPDHLINTINNALSMSYLEVTLRYDEPAFNTTTPITNKASITYTPLGGSPITLDENSGANGTFCTSDLIETHTLEVPDARATLVKSLRTASPVFAGGTVEYNINFSNTGNVALDNVVITETVPAELTYHSLRLDALGQVQSVHYQTNLNASWVSLPAGTAPVLPAGEKIIKIRFTLVSPYNPGQTFSGTNILRFITNSDITEPTTVENCLEWTTTTTGISTDAVCNNNLQVNPESTMARVVYSSGHSPRCGTIFSVGMDLTISGVIRSETGYAGLENPMAAFFVPKGFQYISGSENFNPQTSGVISTPVLTIVEDFMEMEGGMYDMYKWTFPAGTVVPSGTEMGLSVKLKITNQVQGGTDQSIRFVAEGSNVSSRSTGDTYGFTFTDINDWDGDGNTTEQFRVSRTSFLSCALNISASASMESIKWVKGLLDEDYSRYPAFGQTVPGGNADYKLIVKNTGNIPMKDIKIIDIMPFVGDKGVIDPQNRNSEWRPNLARPISAPAGITVYYSTEQNPCRDEVRQPGDPSPFPTGCVDAAWSVTPPADITRVQSVKIDFGTRILNGGDSLIFTWPMRAPVTAPTDGEIAWNSFGFVATRTDNNTPLLAAEPIKVGIRVVTGLPAYYGDRVWYDDNRNGIQDAGEAGVDGVRVSLYAPAVAGVQNPAADSLVNFTITGNGGLYKFSNLTPGEYYAVFYLPSGYSISPDNQGTNDAVDSDGIPGTLGGEIVTIVPITYLDEEEEDYTWDQGIYCQLTPAVSPIQVVALNESVTLTASGGSTYLWSGPNGFTATTASITINAVTPADTGTYTVTIMDGECRASVSTEIQIEDCPVIAAPQITPQTICAGESVILTGTCVSPATIVWYSDEELTTELGSTTVNPAVTTTYYAVCKDGDCVSEESTQAVVTVTEVPTISIAGAAVCAADGLTYSATVTATAGAVITTSAGVVSGNTVSGIPSGTRAIIRVTLGTCSDSTSVTQNCTIPCLAPNPAVTGSATVCVGESVTLEASGCTTGYTYLWSTGATTATVTVTPATTTTYTVVCVDSDLAGCESTTAAEAVVTVTEKTAAPTGVTASPSEIISGETSELSATCAAGLTPHWFTDEELTMELTSTTVSPVTTTTYYVICGEDKECAIPSQVTVTVTDEPLVFDLALRKTTAPGSKTIYKVGDLVTFDITVFNQGNVVATSVDLVDYIPTGLTLQTGSDWTLDGDKARWVGAVTNLAPGAQQTVQISFVVNASATGVLINTAEISGATNPENLEEIDSTPDDDKDNDGPVKNDEIEEDGKDGRDEDDHDIEPISICPDAKCLSVKTERKK
jgi:uncharacterized repeat protein (TIGR01451 family)